MNVTLVVNGLGRFSDCLALDGALTRVSGKEVVGFKVSGNTLHVSYIDDHETDDMGMPKWQSTHAEYSISFEPQDEEEYMFMFGVCDSAEDEADALAMKAKYHAQFCAQFTCP